MTRFYQNVEDVVSVVKSGHRIFIHGAAATPNVLLNSLISQADRLKDVELIHLHTEGSAEYAHPKHKNSFKIANLFVGSNIRNYLDYNRVDYLPCFLSEVPQLFRSNRRPLDVAMIHVSPPDQHGFCTLGVSVDVALAAIESAQIVIAQINKNMPRVHGDGFIHISKIHHAINIDEKLFEPIYSTPTQEELKIGEHISTLVEDGSTLQVGIGPVPNAVLLKLNHHRNLGLHTEMWSDGALELIKNGVINNSKKRVHAGKSVSAFLMGSQKLYDFVNDNPSVVQFGADYVNSPNVIMRNPNVVAINSAVEIDLTGQVCADSIGTKIISGVGGQMDFIRGAALSPGGKPIIAITSKTKKNISRIVPTLRQGSGVVTTRSHVHYVVTEYGIADLYAKTLTERAQLLISIAHPEERERLEKYWKKNSSFVV